MANDRNSSSGNAGPVIAIAAIAVGAIAGIISYFAGRRHGRQEQANTNQPTPGPSTVSQPSSFNNDENDTDIGGCPICFSSTENWIKNSTVVLSTNCGHLFCNGCLTKWLTIKKFCPKCRSPINDNQTRRVYMN